MIKKVALGIIWLGFVLYTIWIAPLDQPDTWPLVQKLLTLKWTELNPFIPVIFSLMGVWPMIYAGLMFADGRMQNFRAWPYFLGSNFTGVICLMPYFLLRRRSQAFVGERDRWLRLVDSRLMGLSLLLGTVGLLSWVVVGEDWNDYVQQFQTRAFVHLISLDFCLMTLIFPLTLLFEDDLRRRGIHQPWVFWAVALVPLFGPLIYLSTRPELPEVTPEAMEQAVAPLELKPH
jgi:hypothetical protein